MELLTSVRVVGRPQPKLQDLPHVLSAIDAFADAPALWSIEIAASRRLFRLLNRLAAREPSVVHAALGRRRFLQGVRRAVTSGQVDVIKWWTTRYRPEHSLSDSELIELIGEAARLGRLELLQWLHAQYKIPPHEYRPYSYWNLVTHHADVVYWLHEQNLDNPVYVSLNQVARTGDSVFLQWLLDHKDNYDMSNVMSIAMERSDLATIQWHIMNLLADSFCERTFSFHFGSGSLPKILETRWPQEYYRSTGFHSMYDSLRLYLPEPLEVTEDHLQVFRWLNNEFEWKDPQYRDRWVDCVAMHAASCNNFEMIKALEGTAEERPRKRFRGNVSRFHLPMWLAAFHGHLEMVQWLHAQGERHNTNDAMDGAAAGGHLEIVQWLHQNQPYGPKKEVMDVAAWNGHVHILQWIHENDPEYGCTHRAIDLAASRGHLPVIQWLHANRSEGYTKKAIDDAIANGHLDVVQWLQANPSEVFPRISINKVIASGHVEIVEFLQSNRPKCTVSAHAVKEVVGKGNLKMVQWLQTNLSPVWTSEAVLTAISAGHVDVVRYVVQHCGVRCTEAMIKAACEAGQFGLVEWLYTYGPDPDVVAAGVAPYAPYD